MVSVAFARMLWLSMRSLPRNCIAKSQFSCHLMAQANRSEELPDRILQLAPRSGVQNPLDILEDQGPSASAKD